MKEEPLTIIIGGNPDRDLEKLFAGDRTQPKNMLYLKSYKQFLDLMSPKKIDLLRELAKMEPYTVCELAKKTKRKQEAISRDIKELKQKGFVKTRKEGQKTKISPIFKKIEITIQG
jgi:predicted transcriptional regulator